MLFRSDEDAGQELGLGEGGGLAGLGAESFLHRLLERPGLALGLGWFGWPFSCLTPRRRSQFAHRSEHG